MLKPLLQNDPRDLKTKWIDQTKAILNQRERLLKRKRRKAKRRARNHLKGRKLTIIQVKVRKKRRNIEDEDLLHLSRENEAL